MPFQWLAAKKGRRPYSGARYFTPDVGKWRQARRRRSRLEGLASRRSGAGWRAYRVLLHHSPSGLAPGIIALPSPIPARTVLEPDDRNARIPARGVVTITSAPASRADLRAMTPLHPLPTLLIAGRFL